jgi:hypothetical protein
MKSGAEDSARPVLLGQVLRRNRRREAAIFLHRGELWVADFVDGKGALVDAVTWFRFHCAAPGSAAARRRMALESATPLSCALIRRIERLAFPGRSP